MSSGITRPHKQIFSESSYFLHHFFISVCYHRKTFTYHAPHRGALLRQGEMRGNLRLLQVTQYVPSVEGSLSPSRTLGTKSHRLHNHMTTITHDEQSVYEIGYLIASSIPEEKVPEEADALKKIITDAGASVIAEEAPHREHLAYTISKKTVSGGYDKYDVAYFGWVKFELGSDKVEAVKQAIEVRPAVLRTLLISTVRENTYLGKRAPAFIQASVVAPATISGALTDEKKDVAPATIEEMDKSIDNMVKEV